MKIIKNVILLLIFAFSCACNDSSIDVVEVEEHTLQVPETDLELGESITEAIIVSEVPQVEEESTTNIRFKEFSLSINRLVIYDENNELHQIQNDTVEISVELGETIESQLISISSQLLKDFTIEQRYETSITIMNEGPHCDMIEWKHFYSEWKQLKRNKSGQFICDKYTEKESEKFPKVSVDELVEAVKEKCGEDWSKLIENVKKPTEYPSGVGISRYFLRITGKRKDNGHTIIKLIRIETPMGC